jgi:hypothetical protein
MLPAQIEPLEALQLPPDRRPEQMPSLPVWAASRLASLRDEAQPDSQGKWRPIPTIPHGAILKAAEREAIEHHTSALDALCANTPESSIAAEEEMLVVLTKFMFVLPSVTQNELSAEARGEAYLEAVSDLTVWAVRAAVRRWNRGDCGKDARGRTYDYHWCPAPAELRHIAFAEMWRVKGRARDLRRLLAAEPRKEFTEQQREAMLSRLAAVYSNIRTSLVGRNGSSEVAGSAPV